MPRLKKIYQISIFNYFTNRWHCQNVNFEFVAFTGSTIESGINVALCLLQILQKPLWVLLLIILHDKSILKINTNFISLSDL